MIGPIALTWRGQTYTISEREVFEVADKIEDVCTIFDLVASMKNPKFVRLAKCYAIMLRAAGAPATDREVHAEFMAALRNGEGIEKHTMRIQAIETLLAILMQDAPEADRGDGGKPKDG